MAKKNSKNKLKIFLAVVLIIVGLILVFHRQIQSWMIENLLDPPGDLSSEEVEMNLEQEANFDFETVEDLDFNAILQARSQQNELPVIGGIAIPDVSLSVSILKGVANANLAVGAGTMKPDQQMGVGNYALAGHNRIGGQLFNPLHTAELGMTIYLTDAENIYIYEITNIEMVDATRIDVIEDRDETMITLVTCNTDGSRRLIVQGAFLEQTPVDQASSEILDYFNT